MRAAVLSEDGLFVENVIILVDEGQIPEMADALGRTVLNAETLGLVIGDFWNGEAWTRNVNGIWEVVTV